MTIEQAIDTIYTYIYDRGIDSWKTAQALGVLLNDYILLRARVASLERTSTRPPS